MTPQALRRLIGHQRPSIVFALRGTVAVLAAVAAAALLKLENPYWAGMTALIVIQPTRGLLFEKSFYRLLGTAAGSLAGYWLLSSTRDPLWISAGISVWIAACVGIGNLLYGLRSYACLMAGCTGVVVAMSVYQHPSHLSDIAFGRVAGITVGIIVATGVTALFISGNSSHELSDRLRRAAREALALLALQLRADAKPSPVRREHDILIELAEIEGLIDVAGAGSLLFKKRKRHLRSLVASLLSLVAAGRLTRGYLTRPEGAERACRQWRDQFSRELEEVAEKLESSPVAGCTAEMAALAAEAAEHLPRVGEPLEEIAGLLHPAFHECDSLTEGGGLRQMQRIVPHRDWAEARRAAARAGLALAAVGVTWSSTGWTKGPLMLMAMSIMLSIFSVKEHPAFFVGQIFFGAALGSATAVLSRTVLLPGVSDPFTTLALIAPFILLGVFCMAQRRTAIPATDATLFYLFVTQPGMSIAVTPADLVLGAVAMALGVGTAWLCYRYLVPINPAMRLDALMASIMREMAGLAGGETPAALERSTARLRHRVIRLVALAARHDAGNRRLLAAAMAALAAADGVRRQRASCREDLPPSTATVVGEALGALSGLSTLRGDATPVLERAAAALYQISEPASAPAPRTAPGFAATHERCWEGGRLPCHIWN